MKATLEMSASRKGKLWLDCFVPEAQKPGAVLSFVFMWKANMGRWTAQGSLCISSELRMKQHTNPGSPVDFLGS